MRLLALLASVLISACSSAPPPPDWQIESRNALERAQNAYFAGNTKVYEFEAGLARKAISSTGQLALAARLELALCAAQVAALDYTDCAKYQALAAFAAEPERAYANFLQAQSTNAALLPEQHRAAGAALGSKAALANLPAMQAEALLISTSVLFKAGLASPAMVGQAIDAASAQGWRRPLLAWLGIALKRAQTENDSTQVALLQARIALVETKR
jgi:hypothetical protein